MFALSPEADMLIVGINVCFVPLADSNFRDCSSLLPSGNVTQVVPELIADCIDHVGISS
jgi:hypothetical protein